MYCIYVHYSGRKGKRPTGIRKLNLDQTAHVSQNLCKYSMYKFVNVVDAAIFLIYDLNQIIV